LATTLGAEAGGSPGTLLMTPWTSACRTTCDAAEGVSPNHPEGPVFAVSSTLDPRQAVVDIPAAGFSWIADRNLPVKSTRGRFRKSKPMVEDSVVQNEFMEVHLDPATGG